MDFSKLEYLHTVSSYHKVAELGGKVVGFLLAVGSEKKFINENFVWFANTYLQFIYIDRIVIEKACKGLGIGRTLYEDLFDYTRAKGIPVIGCEFNLYPINEASKQFHLRLGFKQVGERIYNNNSKVVSMQAADI